jgi:hypothetical protein
VKSNNPSNPRSIIPLRRQILSKDRNQIKQLQSQIDIEEAELQREIDGALVEIRTVESDRSEKVKEAIKSAIDNI